MTEVQHRGTGAERAGTTRRALLSGLNDRTEGLARRLDASGWELWASSGTAGRLAAGGVSVRDLSRLTGIDRAVGGRVKTLHPAVHAGILARASDPADAADVRTLGGVLFDLVAVELYPFAAAWRRGLADEELLEAVDIGGVALIRAAAKNWRRVAVLCDPTDYDAVERSLADGGPDASLRRRLAARAFALTGRLDAAVATWLGGGEADPADGVPLRYGENPHQAGWFVPAPGPATGLAALSVLAGEGQLSYTNLLDLDGAWQLAQRLAEGGGGAAVAVKHASPIGAARGGDGADLVRRARAGDPVSAFGGVLCLLAPLDPEAAAEIGRTFWEVVAAPAATIDPAAAQHLKRRLPRLRLVGLPTERAGARWQRRSVAGGELWQEPDAGRESAEALEHVAGPVATAAEREDLAFALTCAAAARSNAVAVARGQTLLGVGSGFPNRVEAIRRATALAKGADGGAVGAVLGSDAFFPFPDNLEACAEADVRVVAAPAGSRRDGEVRAAAERLGIALYAVPRRHFRH